METSQKEQIIDEAVSKFKEVFQKSGIIETTSQLQRQLAESQRTVRDQAREIEKLAKADKANKAMRPNTVLGKLLGELMNRRKNFIVDNQEKVKKINELMSRASDSELTVYKNTVENQMNKRESSSSDEILNFSDEVTVIETNLIQSSQQMEVKQQNLNSLQQDSLIDEFIADTQK